jgi:hypothetical protein
MTKLKRFSLIIITLLVAAPLIEVNAQANSISPYSRFGIGDLYAEGFTYQTAMGGAGSALGSSFYINSFNPASYVHDTVTIFEFGLRGEYATYSTSDQTTSSSSANFSHFCLAFPVAKMKWSAALGITPVSNVGYDLELYDNIQNIGPVKNSYYGDGGFSRFFLGNGFRILKNLSAGVNISYMFGTINNEKSVEFPYGVNYFNTKYINSVTVSDFYFNYGLMYHVNLKNNKKLSFAVSGAPDTKTNATNYEYYYNYTKIAGFEIVKDTILKDLEEKGELVIPAYLRFGTTFSSYGKWSASLDVNFQQWENFRNFGKKDSLTNSYSVHAGGEYRMEKLVLRAGGKFRKNYLELRNEPLNEYGISMGVGLVKLFPKRPASTVNFALEFLRRGTTESGLVKENYIRFHIGLTLADIWFMKPKYE